MTQPSQSTYKSGDTITISRGKLRGETGTVLDVDNDKQEYAVKTSAGLRVVSFSAVKAPVEQTFTRSELETVLDQAAQEYGSEATDFIRDSLFTPMPEPANS